MAYTKEHETKLIYDIVDRFGSDDKVVLRRMLERLLECRNNRIKNEFEKFVDDL